MCIECSLHKPFTPMHTNSFLYITCVIIRCLTRPLNSTVFVWGKKNLLKGATSKCGRACDSRILTLFPSMREHNWSPVNGMRCQIITLLSYPRVMYCFKHHVYCQAKHLTLCLPIFNSMQLQMTLPVPSPVLLCKTSCDHILNLSGCTLHLVQQIWNCTDE